MAILYGTGELILVEYGQNEFLGSCRTEHMSPFLISVQICPPRGTAPASKTLAYLVDLHTIRIMDLLSASVLATINHDAKVDWLVCV